MSSFPTQRFPYPPTPSPPSPRQQGLAIGAAMGMAVVFLVLLFLWRNPGALAWCARVYSAGNDEMKVSCGRHFLQEAVDELARQDAAIEALEQVMDEDGLRADAAHHALEAHDEAFPGGRPNMAPKTAVQIAVERAQLAKTRAAAWDLCDVREQHLRELRVARLEAALRVAEMRVELARLEQELDRDRLSSSENPVNAGRTFFKLEK